MRIIQVKNNKYKNTIAFVFILFLVLPVGVLAQTNFIVCNGPDCTFGHLLLLVKNVLDWLVMISFSAAIITLMWAGFLYLTTGIADKKTQAKAMLWKVVIGFAIILAAWVIVKTIVSVILKPEIGGRFLQF
ncbi:MAG: pilin [Patescibacteria group bacterium]